MYIYVSACRTRPYVCTIPYYDREYIVAIVFRYETFEKDPVKYEQYRKAAVLAFIDLVNKNHGTFTSDNAAKGELAVKPLDETRVMEVTLMVVGAGRGPLVRSSLLASREVSELVKTATNDTLQIKLTVFAVEKVCVLLYLVISNCVLLFFFLIYQLNYEESKCGGHAARSCAS
jgi:hypothetical protein